MMTKNDCVESTFDFLSDCDSDSDGFEKITSKTIAALVDRLSILETKNVASGDVNKKQGEQIATAQRQIDDITHLTNCMKDKVIEMDKTVKKLEAESQKGVTLSMFLTPCLIPTILAIVLYTFTATTCPAPPSALPSAPQHPTIDISGMWECALGSNTMVAFDMQGERLMQKWKHGHLVEYTLGVRHTNGFMATVRDGKLVQEATLHGSEIRSEYSIENGNLVVRRYMDDEEPVVTVYNRISNVKFEFPKPTDNNFPYMLKFLKLFSGF